MHKATITLKNPLDADDRIALMVMHVVGQIPSDAIYTVEVTNNAYDESPVWENITNYIENGWNYSFVNTTCTAGQWGFNFRITVQRGESGVGGYITSIDGGFEGE